MLVLLAVAIVVAGLLAVTLLCSVVQKAIGHLWFRWGRRRSGMACESARRLTPAELELVEAKAQMNPYSDEAWEDARGAAEVLKQKLPARTDICDISVGQRFAELVVTVWFRPDAPFAPETLPEYVAGWRVYPMHASSEEVVRRLQETDEQWRADTQSK
ncbi:MAG: hypothetical protein ACODAJ_03720 [Planctomycetota bacterium]